MMNATNHPAWDANAEAQRLIAAHGLDEATIHAGYMAASYHGSTRSPRTAAFWADVATLLRLETQSDETEVEATERVARISRPSFGWPGAE